MMLNFHQTFELFTLLLLLLNQCEQVTSSSSVSEYYYNLNFLRKTASTQRQLASLPLVQLLLTTQDESNINIFVETLGKANLLNNPTFCTSTADIKCFTTIFAPVDAAFDRFHGSFWDLLNEPNWIYHLQNFLALHIYQDTESLLTPSMFDGQQIEMLNKEIVTINDGKSGISLSTAITRKSQLIEIDILAADGVLHTMKKVVSPAFFDIDIFTLDSHFTNDFKIVSELFRSIGLVNIKNEFTVFVPTDAAFLALGTSKLEELRADMDALRDVLLNHVVIGVVPSFQFTDGLVLSTAGGTSITLQLPSVSDESIIMPDTIVTLPDPSFNFTTGSTLPITLNDESASIIFLNLLARNGIAHVIDRVLLASPIVIPPVSAPTIVIPPASAPTIVIPPAPAPTIVIPPASVPTPLITMPPTNVPSNVPSTIPSTIGSEVPSSIPSTSSILPTSTSTELPTSPPIEE